MECISSLGRHVQFDDDNDDEVKKQMLFAIYMHMDVKHPGFDKTSWLALDN